MSNSHFKVDTSLRINVRIALALLIICPLALWQFHFRMKGEVQKEITPQEMTINFFRAFNKSNFDANLFFSETIQQYDTLADITPEDVNAMIAEERKNNMFPINTVKPETIKVSHDNDGNTEVALVTTCVAYRRSIVKYVIYKTLYTFTYNKEKKIVRLTNEQVTPTEYSVTRPK